MPDVYRQGLLHDSLATFEGQRVAAFFNVYADKGNAQAFGAGAPASSSGSQGAGAAPTGEVITREQFLRAQKDVQTGRMTPEEFEKLSNLYIKQMTAARQ